MGKTIAEYLSMRYDLAAAEYFANGRRKIIDVSPNDNFTLILKFDNSERRLYDVRPLLQKGTVFAPLAELTTFRRVYLDDTHCVAWDIDPSIDSNKVWSNKIDLCPDSCYLDSVPIV